MEKGALMRRFFTALTMCFSMFSILPVPAKIWDEGLRRRMLRFFPLLGIVLGGVWALAVLALRATGLGSMLAGAIIAAIPVILSGGIHMDGYMDVADAMLSRRSREEKLRILKDPHCGAFAVIAAIMLFMFMFAGSCEAYEANISPVAFILIPTVSRALALIAVSSMTPLTHSEYSAPAKSGADTLIGVIWLAAIFCAAGVYFVFMPALELGGGALIASGATALGYGVALILASRSLGGISGDVSGFALTIGEVFGLIALGILGGLL